MFYSHEILTSRKHGVATIWLVATLGAKSNSKRLTRKAICDVDVPKACETIIQPKAPMALRLQGSLLYGVTRVYSQQCGYVLSDVQATQASIRTLYKATRDDELDPKAGKAIPAHLVLTDDPAFLPDMALPDLDISFLSLDDKYNSQRSSQSMMSIRQRSASEASQLLPGLKLPSLNSEVSVGQYQLPLDDPFGHPSIGKPLVGQDQGIFDDEALMYQDDLLFEFDVDGNMRDIPLAEREARYIGGPHPPGRLSSCDSAASGRVRREHEEARAGQVRWIPDDEGCIAMMNYGNENSQILPDAEAFPAAGGALMSGALHSGDNPFHSDHIDHVYSSGIPFPQELSSISAEAPQKQTKAKAKRAVTDYATTLVNNDLIRWRDEYLENMTAATLQKSIAKTNLQAKKNGSYFVYGSGLNGVGNGLGSLKINSPLNMFSGDALLTRLTGVSSRSANTKRSKRGHVGLDNEQHPKRSRHSENQHEYAFEGDALIPGSEEGINPYDRSDVEIGREALSALADHPSSTMMPWNVSASVHSHQRGLSSLRGPASQITGSISVLDQRRLASASPLVGRGSALPGDLESFALLYEDDNIMHGRNGLEPINAASRAPGFLGAAGGHGSDAEPEVLGPARSVDTQIGGTPQWVRQALDRESDNFFEYVRNSIYERSRDELDVSPGGENNVFVTFLELFHTESLTRLVAAQAFHHVLSLATKGRIWVRQLGVDELEMDGEIRIGVFG